MTLKETFCVPLEQQEHFNCVCLLKQEIISMYGALRKEINSVFAQWSSFVFSFQVQVTNAIPNLNANKDKYKLSSALNQFCQISQCTFVFRAEVGLSRRFMCSSSFSTKKWPSASQRNPTGTGAPPVINVLEINWGGVEDYGADSACFQLFLLDLFFR